VLALGVFLLGVAAPVANGQSLAPAEHYRLRLQADSLVRAARLDDAIALYRRLLANEPRDGALWGALGTALFTREPLAAAEAYEQAAHLGGGFAPQLMINAARLFAPTQPERALDLIERALAGHWPNRERLRADSALVRALRNQPRFRQLAGVPPANLNRIAGWQFDLDYLVQEAKRLHTSPEREAFLPAFDSSAASLRARIPQLNDEEIVNAMRALVVLLDDGHTHVQQATPPRRLPLDLYWFRDGIVVTADHRDIDPGLTRGRVLALNKVPIDDVVQRLSAYIPRDNEMGIRAVAPAHLTNLSLLRSAGLLPDTNAVTLRVRLADGRETDARVSFEQTRAVNARLQPFGDSAARPLWLQAPGTTYWYRALPDARAVYFQYNAVRHMPGQNTEQFARELRRVLEQTRSNTLIVDLRHNGGGNSYLFPPLIKAMIVFRESSPEHRVFAIVGRHTFSAAQNFTVAIDQWVGATFVGEPSGSRINFTGESSVFPLPVSGTRANISWRWHQYGQWVDTRPWIVPQVPAELSSADYFNQRDPALEAILELLARPRT
jgi:hypothetical protein